MKKLLFLLVLFCASLGFATPASAKGFVIYSNGEELKTLQKLPADFVLDDGKHVNFGVHYESFSIFWMPVWNYGEYKYALINDAEDTWVELTLEDAKALGKEYKFDVPDQPTLPLMTQIGLKPAFIIVGLYIIYSMFSGRKEEDEEGTAKEQVE